jgi:hypothetical protein
MRENKKTFPDVYKGKGLFALFVLLFKGAHMSRRLAYRPRHHITRAAAPPLRFSHQSYLRQRWAYREKHPPIPTRRPPGYGLGLVPWGWRLMRETIRLRA